jgi:two-component system, cell cycle response regulator DivK
MQEARLVVVEDDPNNCLVVVELLKAGGVQAQNIVELDGGVLDYLRTRPADQVDLILLDIQLPGKNGYTILEELRTDPHLADIPVVALTANIMREDIKRAQAAGFNGFIGKPIDGFLFAEWIQRLLAGESVWTVN